MKLDPTSVQAFSSAAGLIATVVLVAITWRYVALTKQLADVAAEQLKLNKEATIARWYELWSLTKLFNRTLELLPDESRQHSLDSDIRSVPLWDQSDLNRLLALAAQLGHETGNDAALAVSSLTWLRDRIDAVRKVTRAQGFDYNRELDWPRWCQELETARARVGAIVDAVRPRLQP